MWTLEITERILAWKKFRQEIGSLPAEEAMLACEELWSHARPRVGYYLDYTTPSKWPDPWSLLAQEKFCELSVGWGIFNTLLASKQTESNVFEFIIAEENNRLFFLVSNGNAVVGYKDKATSPITVVTSMDVMHRISGQSSTI